MARVDGIQIGSGIPVEASLLPPDTIDKFEIVADDAARLAIDAYDGDEVIQADNGSEWIYDDVNGWVKRIKSSSIDVTFFQSATDYIEVGNSTYSTIASVIFPGTDLFTPSLFKAILSRSNQSGSSAIRIFDYTNNNEIASITWTPNGKTIYTTSSLLNLPTGPATFEIQARKVSGGKSRVHYVGIT